MSQSGRIAAVEPRRAIPGGEVLLECTGFRLDSPDEFRCTIGGKAARIIGASSDRVLAIVPHDSETGKTEVSLSFGSGGSASAELMVGERLAGELHQVASPAIDPKDDSIVLTRSGARGQELPVTLLRLSSDGVLSEMSAVVMNPTGAAFDPHGRLVVTNRADGEVVQINNDSEIVPLAGELGVATGIAYDKEGDLFVGDRSGAVLRLGSFEDVETWAVVEPSVSAYHMAFGPDGFLYLSAPGLCSHDVIYRADLEGNVEVFFKGLGRPQGLAFDENGNLYVAACLKGRHGIVRITYDGKSADLYIAGMGIVGLCFTRNADMIVATGDSVYKVETGVRGILLD